MQTNTHGEFLKKTSSIVFRWKPKPGPRASSIIYKLTISTTVFIHYLYIQLSGLRGLCGIVMIIIAIAIDECYWDHEHIALLIGNDGDN